MKKIYCLCLLSLLCACNNGGGHGGGSEPVVPDDNAPVVTPEPDIEEPDILEPNVSDIEEALKDSEKLFGKGQGLGAMPTGLLTQEDLIGNSYLSFASWGDVYDIDHYIAENASDIPFFTTTYPESFSFMETTASKFGSNLKYNADVSVADAVFTGPALMKKHLTYVEEGGVNRREIDYSPDYGSMKMTFGHDIRNKVIEFTMHNPENNLILDSHADVRVYFDESRDNARVFYSTQYSHEPEARPVTTISTDIGHMFKPTTGYYYHDKIYEGYGSKQ